MPKMPKVSEEVTLPAEPSQDVAIVASQSRPYRAKCLNCGWQGEWYETYNSPDVGQLCPSCYIPAVEDRYTPTEAT